MSVNSDIKKNEAPMKYYTNTFNQLSKERNERDNIKFTPVGNIKTNTDASYRPLPLPTRSKESSTTFTLNYSTSPFLGQSSNINPYETDMDLTLKTGLLIRPKGSENDISAIKYPHFGDLINNSDAVNNSKTDFKTKEEERQFENNQINGGIIWPLGGNISGLSSRVVQSNVSQAKNKI